MKLRGQVKALVNLHKCDVERIKRILGNGRMIRNISPKDRSQLVRWVNTFDKLFVDF